jgi:hypothetical protein
VTSEVLRRQFMICSLAVVFTGAALMIVGCGSGEPQLPPLHPVKGSVKFRGRPAVGFRVVFHPQTDIGKLQFAPSAITGETGEFELRSYHPSDGAPVGDYAVTFEWPDHLNKDTDTDPVPEVDKLRGVYANPASSKIHIQVKPGLNELAPFELK